MIKINYCSVDKHGNILCRNSKVFRDNEKVYSIIVENTRELYVFETQLDTRVICSSDNFQTHVWGTRRYDTWFLRKGLNKCVVLANVRIDCFNGNICIASRRKHVEELNGILVNILEIIKSLNTRGENVFLLDEDTGVSVFFENIVSGRSIEQLLNHIRSLLINKYGSAEEADIVFNQLRKQISIE